MILTFDFSSPVPIYMQIRNQIIVGIAEEKLKPGEKLPTIRALAEESGINMMTVSKAYQLLKQEGYIITDRRSGAVVAPRGKAVVRQQSLDALRLNISELRLSGMSREDILNLCSKLYEEGEKKL
jgi:DNA-binding transcriptional regulator YhcF (GntR family)